MTEIGGDATVSRSNAIDEPLKEDSKCGLTILN